MLLETILSFLLQIDNAEVITEVAEQSSNAVKFFGVKIVNWNDFTELIIRFVLNLGFLLIIAKGIYYRKANRKDYLFTYILLGLVIFLLCYTLNNVKLQIGFALGLFAIFGILRYRTDAMPIKEMTYLFVIIGISVINALSNKKVSYAELLFVNTAIIIILFILENVWLLRHESVKMVTYEKIELIKPERNKELIADLEQRTGIKISRVEIGKIDFLRDTARLNVYYFQSDQINIADNESISDRNSNDED